MPVRTAVLVLNHNGRRFLEACLSSLGAMDGFHAPGLPKDPQVVDEVWLVDNGSQDGSTSMVLERFPWVRVFGQAENLGFSKAYNHAAQTIEAEWIAFLNNDTRVAPDWLTQLHACRQRHPEAKAVASHLVSWDGQKEDFVGGDTFFFGQAWQKHLGEPRLPALAQEKPLLFGCGGALLVHRETFLELAGFDEDYFSFFEDVDLGWRLNLAGHPVWFCPQALVFHQGHGSWGRGYPPNKRLLLERNSLATVYKNWGDERMGVFFLASAALTFFRAWGAYAPAPLSVPPHLNADSLAHLQALAELAEWLPALQRKRVEVQAQRRRSDEKILPLFGALADPPLPENPEYRRLYHRLVHALGISGQSLPRWSPEANQGALKATKELLNLWQRAARAGFPPWTEVASAHPAEKFPVPLASCRLGWRLWQALHRVFHQPLTEVSLQALLADLQKTGRLWETETTPTWVWSDPPVSIVVRTQDRPQFLRQALTSIAQQHKRPQEVVVVNDGGQNPQAAVGELEQVLPLRFIHHSKPLGRSAAADRGLREATGAFVGFLDDDDQYHPHHLAKLAEAVAHGARVAYSDVEVVYEDGPAKDPTARGAFAFPFDPTRLLFENYIPISAVLLEKSLGLEVGGFDTSLFYFEDWDLWLRLAEKTTFIHCPGVSVSYFVRPNLGHGTATSGAHRWPHFARVWQKHHHRISGDDWAAYFSTYVEPSILRWENLEKEIQRCENLEKEIQGLRWELSCIHASRAWKLVQRLRRLLGREPARPF